MYQTLRPEVIDLDGDVQPVPNKIKGLRRHEALRMEGPLPFGMDDQNGSWAKAEKERLENSLSQEFGISRVDDLWRQDLEEVLEQTYVANKSFEQVLSVLDDQGIDSRQEATTLMFWGLQRRWDTTTERMDWIELLQTYEEGKTLLEWFLAGTRLTFFRSLQNATPHHSVGGKAANDKERAQRDIQIRRNLVVSLEEADFPILLNGKYLNGSLLKRAVEPKAPASFLHALLR